MKQSNSANYYYELAEEVTPRLEKLMQLPVPRGVPIRMGIQECFCGECPTFLAEYRTSQKEIIVYENNVEATTPKMDRDRLSSIIGHELVHATQFQNFPELAEYFLKVNSSHTLLLGKDYYHFSTFIEGDATHLERKLLNPANQVVFDLNEKETIEDLYRFPIQRGWSHRYPIGRTIISHIENSIDRNAVNAIYALPPKTIAALMYSHIEEKFPPTPYEKFLEKNAKLLKEFMGFIRDSITDNGDVIISDKYDGFTKQNYGDKQISGLQHVLDLFQKNMGDGGSFIIFFDDMSEDIQKRLPNLEILVPPAPTRGKKKL